MKSLEGIFGVAKDFLDEGNEIILGEDDKKVLCLILNKTGFRFANPWIWENDVLSRLDHSGEGMAFIIPWISGNKRGYYIQQYVCDKDPPTVGFQDLLPLEDAVSISEAYLERKGVFLLGRGIIPNAKNN